MESLAMSAIKHSTTRNIYRTHPCFASHSRLSICRKQNFSATAYNPSDNFNLMLSNSRLHYLAEASRRISNYARVDNLFDDSKASKISYDEDDDDDDDEEDRSLDLLVKFLQNVFRKLSKKVKKAARSVLPPTISPQLVGFSVNGVLILASLWIAKAFLQVICAVGSAVFVVILLLRLIWSAIAYLRVPSNPNGFRGFEDGSWNNVRPAT